MGSTSAEDFNSSRQYVTPWQLTRCWAGIVFWNLFLSTTLLFLNFLSNPRLNTQSYFIKYQAAEQISLDDQLNCQLVATAVFSSPSPSSSSLESVKSSSSSPGAIMNIPFAFFTSEPEVASEPVSYSGWRRVVSSTFQLTLSLEIRFAAAACDALLPPCCHGCFHCIMDLKK